MQHNYQVIEQKIQHAVGHTMSIFGMMMLIFVLILLIPANTFISSAYGSDILVELTNKTREQYNVNPLNPNSTLMSAAQAKAEHMVDNNYFAHFAPDGKTPWEFFEESGYSYKIAGENLAITNEDEQAVINGWMNSPTHRDNLLNNQYSDIGIGIASYGEYQNHSNTPVIVAFYATANSPLLVTGAEPTNTAGTIAALRPSIYDPKVYAAIAIGAALLTAGVVLESRHIRKSHRLI
jgi:hypothetical protein